LTISPCKEIAMSRFRSRLERLERARPPQRRSIEWANFCRHPDDWVPDGIIDWEELKKPVEPPSAEIERRIAAVGQPDSAESPEQT
jgi:hypothetical protein